MDLPTTERVALPREAIREVAGFGMACRADGYLFQPKSVSEISEVFALARSVGRKVVLRGAGRSYGDASILSEGLILDLTQMRHFLSWDEATGIAECEPGVTIEDLWRTGLPNGWWPPVVSGTMFPTLGGALAMNIHGKNNFRQGTLGEHVLELDFVTVDGSLKVLHPSDELFWAAISSAGLLGVITRVKLQMKRVVSGSLRVYAESVPGWDAQFEAFEKRADSADYMVSWVDCFAKGNSAGRGLFHAAWHDTEENQESLLEFNQDLPPKVAGVIPKNQVWRILRLFNNRFGMKWLNMAKHLSAKMIGNRKFHKQSLVAFSFLLDYVPDWRNAYLPGGFIQYQSFVPRAKAREVFAEQVRLSQEAKLEPYLGVLKLHRPDRFLMSHGVDGFSLALDYKVTEANWERLQSLAHRMNDLVVGAQGRFYLAKDATLRAADMEGTLPSALVTLAKFKKRIDPEGLLTSELAQRLNLTPGKVDG
jgi:decaprenylphospho-beta-D-ribofuranose 2-oxidase